MVRRNRATNPLRQTAFWRAQAFFTFSFLASAESSISDLDFDGSDLDFDGSVSQGQ